jgi:hypothetical protein
MAKAKKAVERTGRVFLNLSAVAADGRKIEVGAVLVKQEHLDNSKALQSLYAALADGKDINWHVRPVMLSAEPEGDITF